MFSWKDILAMVWTKVVVIAIVVALVILAGTIGVFEYATGEVEAEWQAKFPSQPRTPRELRGLVDNLYHYRQSTIPAFIPMSGWEDELCAANVVKAANFLLGDERLKVVPAWQFAQANADRIRKVYDRSSDFKIDGQRIVEKKDRVFWLSKILQTVGHGRRLTSDRLYVVGYHYQRTRSDQLIINAGGDLNSHLMLILGRYNGRWWGYHLYHNPEKPQASPFAIDDIGDHDGKWTMSNAFDVVYIWEIKNSLMTPKGEGASLLLVQNSPPYQQVVKHLGGHGRWGYFWDTLKVHFFGRGEHFPQTIHNGRPIVQVLDPTKSGTGWHGQILGFYNGVAVRRHAGSSTRTQYGLGYQCVELVNRYYTQKLRHRNMTKSGHADSYWWSAPAKGLNKRFKNGSREKPRVDDILVFDDNDGLPGDSETKPGHVAVVTQVANDRICIVQQNADRWYGCLPLAKRYSGWYVGDIFKNPTLPCVGWVRR